jgi:hypothetical protein
MQVVVAATNPSSRFKLSVANRTSSMVANLLAYAIVAHRTEKVSSEKGGDLLGPFDLQIYPGTGAFLLTGAEQWIFADGRENLGVSEMSSPILAEHLLTERLK